MRNEEQEIQFKYLINCAVLLSCGAEKILVDGIFSGRQPFDIMDSQLEEAILTGEGDFAGIKYVLVTHCHNDHYNGSKLLKFLKYHPGTTVFLPANAKLDHDKLEGLQARIIRMDGLLGQLNRVNFGSFQIEYMCTGHLTYRYPQHYCLNLIAEHANVLVTADMNLDCMNFLKDFTKKEESWIFANAIVLWHRKWRQQLLDLNFSRIWLYHVASEERDILGYRKKTMVHWKKHRNDVLNWVMLGEEKDEIY